MIRCDVRTDDLLDRVLVKGAGEAGAGYAVVYYSLGNGTDVLVLLDRVLDLVPPGGPLPVPLTPKVKRLIRQRQPFDIYEDQYQRLKHIAEAERDFVNGRGMSQMVREAIDQYLKDHGTPQE
jgi:hypothetical protein